MDWIWCVRCQQAFPDERERGCEGLHCCAYSDCPGRALWDLIAWHDVQELCPDYPAVPEMDRMYTLTL